MMRLADMADRALYKAKRLGWNLREFLAIEGGTSGKGWKRLLKIGLKRFTSMIVLCPSLGWPGLAVAGT